MNSSTEPADGPEAPAAAGATNRCAALRRALEACDLIGWTGLDPRCSETDLLGSLPLPEAERPQRLLGADLVPARTIAVGLPRFFEARASTREGEVVLIDGMNPELDWPALRADLGTPAAQWDWARGRVAIPGGEWVYAERGITVFCNTDRSEVLHLAVYRPVSLATYAASLRPDLGSRRLPLHR